MVGLFSPGQGRSFRRSNTLLRRLEIPRSEYARFMASIESTLSCSVAKFGSTP